MGTIHDKKKRNTELDALLNGSPISSESPTPSPMPKPSAESSVGKTENITTLSNYNQLEIESYSSSALQALSMVDDIVTKNYVMRLSEMDIVPVDKSEIGRDTIVFKVNKMVYEKDEYATEKFINALGAMCYADCSVFLILDGHKDRTDFYIGVRNNDDRRTESSVAETFENSLKGQFPGIELEPCSVPEHAGSLSIQQQLFERFNQASSVCSCSGIPAYKDEDGKYTNQTFIQGIEKLALAMQGKEYTAVVLATNVSGSSLSSVRIGYEQLYTQMSAVATQQVAYSTNESLANAITRTKGTSFSVSATETSGTSHTDSSNESTAKSENWSTTVNESESKQNALGKVGELGGGLTSAGVALAATGVGAPVGLALMAAGGIASVVGTIFGKTKSKGTSETKGSSTTTTHGTSVSDTTTASISHGETKTENFSDSEGKTSTIGTSKNFTLTVHNKHVEEILKRIDNQLERLSIAEGTGVWASGAYFLSYSNDRDTAETGAAIFKSIMQGERSGVEASAVNRWLDTKNPEKVRSLTTAITSFVHPTFIFENTTIGQQVPVNASSLISTAELAMQMGLPRKSVPGFPVLEHVSLGKEVVTHSGHEIKRGLKIGHVFDQGKVREYNPVALEAKSLTQHVFVTGSTGCGKSETVYSLISQLTKVGAKFLIIEPAKGEYKDVFGNEHIYGTNPLKTPLLKINPFRFPEGVHVLEHVDRLIEIFNVCWPMYAAMPAVLKEAILNAYEDCGWDLIKSTNKYSNQIFPTFSDLIWELETVIEMSKYSEEVKSNYKGSLVTRIKSLANGINGEIFCGQEIGDERLFDENVIVDISRIGSQETKALIMGILIMRLNEYRANSGIEANSGLRHVTILEEAHNLLKRCSQEQSMEGSNLAGKSVEMISNAIAEMRTYGEGFIIVDQSPGAVDVSAIRNTNTKIIMRLPEESDRKIAGKSAAMKDYQIDEIAKLPTWVAVVYQNDWEEPVLCKIEKFNGDRFKYEFKEDVEEVFDIDVLIVEILKFMLQKHLPQSFAYDIDLIKTHLSSSSLPTSVKINVLDAIHEFEKDSKAAIWEQSEFVKLSWIVSSMLGIKHGVYKLAKNSRNYDELTSGLKTLIHDRVKDLPTELDMAILQSLLRDYSTGGDECLQRYSDWLSIARERMK